MQEARLHAARERGSHELPAPHNAHKPSTQRHVTSGPLNTQRWSKQAPRAAAGKPRRGAAAAAPAGPPGGPRGRRSVQTPEKNGGQLKGNEINQNKRNSEGRVAAGEPAGLPRLRCLWRKAAAKEFEIKLSGK